MNIKASLMAARGAAATNPCVLRCHNLAPAEGDILRPARLPMRTHTGGWRPWITVDLADGGSVPLARAGDKIGILSGSIALSTVTIDGSIRYTYTFTGGMDITTDTASYRLAVTRTRLTLQRLTERVFPSVRAVAAQSVSASLPSIHLSTDYSDGSLLSRTDLRTISDAMNSLYDDLDTAARDKGLWWMPVLVRLVARNSRGIVLWQSAPQLLLHPGGEQWGGSVALSSNDSRNTLPSTVSASAWQMQVSGRRSLASDIATVDVQATPMLHYADTSRRGTARLRSRADEHTFCTAAVARSPFALWPGMSSSRRSVVSDLIARFDALASTVATIVVPSNDDEWTVTVDARAATTAADDVSAVRTAMRRRPVYHAAWQAWLGAPHHVFYDLQAGGADLSLAARLSVVPFAGYKPSQMAAMVGNSVWYGYARVTMRDGSSVVVTDRGTAGNPLTFGPVLSYPSPDADFITICVTSGGRTLIGSFPLTPDPSGRYSVFTAPDARPFELPEEIDDATVPEAMAPVPDLGDVMIAASAADPVHPLAAMRHSMGTVYAVAPARFGQSSWNFGRARFYAMTSSGIYSVAVASGGSDLSASLIDSRLVVAPTAVADTGDCLYAIASGDLVAISGTKVSTVCSAGGAAGLAYDASRRELWLISSADNPVEVVCLDRGLRRYTLDVGCDPAATVTIGGKVYVGCRSASAVVDVVASADNEGDDVFYRQLGRASTEAATSVAWQAAWQHASLGRNAVLRADLAGEVDSLAIDLCRRHFDRLAPGSDVAFTLRGRILSLLQRTLRLPAATAARSAASAASQPHLDLTLSGTVHSDFIINAVEII